MNVFIAVKGYNMTQVKLPLAVKLKLFESKVANYKALPIFRASSTLREEKALKEFFGPFKRKSVADLYKDAGLSDTAPSKSKSMGDLEKAADAGTGVMKMIDDSEKKLGALQKIGLTDYVRAETKVDEYIDNLVNLYGSVQRYEENPQVQLRAAKLFSKTKQTLAALQKALQDGMAKLTSAIPTDSKMFKATGTSDMDARKAAYTRTAGQQLGDMARAVVGGAGGAGASRAGQSGR